jgi:hypothetical protein
MDENILKQFKRLGIEVVDSDEITITLREKEYKISSPLSAYLPSLHNCKTSYYYDTLKMYDPGQLRKVNFYQPTESLDTENEEIMNNPFISIVGDREYLEDFLIRLDDPNPVNPKVYKYDWEVDSKANEIGNFSKFLSELITQEEFETMK